MSLWILEQAKKFAASVGLPTGGTATQVLSKIDAADYNAQWVDAGTPAAHAVSHQLSGADEIDVTGLTGLPTVPDASDINPQAHGVAAPGISDDYSRGDHVHVSDNTNTTYTAGNGIALESTAFSVAGNTGLTQDADGLSADIGTGDGQVAAGNHNHSGVYVPAGQGLPAGGTATQVLSKMDADDYNTQWVNAGTPDAHAVSHESGGADEVDITGLDGVIPIGGTAGQVLSKIDGTNYNAEWVAASADDNESLRWGAL